MALLRLVGGITYGYEGEREMTIRELILLLQKLPQEYTVALQVDGGECKTLYTVTTFPETDVVFLVDKESAK